MRAAPVLFVLTALILAASPSRGADPGRGRMLYETRCDSCHDTGVHQRAARKARTFDEIREQVARWNGELGGAWRAEEIDDVTLYLNNRYYFYRCPERVCGTGQALAR